MRRSGAGTEDGQRGAVKVGCAVRKRRWRCRLRLWIEVDGESALGPGRAELLEAIDSGHSLSSAAKELGMSYRQAWQHLQVLQDRLGLQVVEAKRGGRDGGGTGLTREGLELLSAYRSFREEVEAGMTRSFEKHFGEWGMGTGC